MYLIFFRGNISSVGQKKKNEEFANGFENGLCAM